MLHMKMAEVVGEVSLKKYVVLSISFAFVGAFLLPYILLLFLIGRPIYYLELIVGQFSGRGPIKMWKCVPALKGTLAGEQFHKMLKIISLVRRGLCSTFFRLLRGHLLQLPDGHFHFLLHCFLLFGTALDQV